MVIEFSDKTLTLNNVVAKMMELEDANETDKESKIMEKERIERMNMLESRQSAEGLEASEREELRILQMEHLAEMMPADEED